LWFIVVVYGCSFFWGFLLTLSILFFNPVLGVNDLLDGATEHRDDRHGADRQHYANQQHQQDGRKTAI
jgi:hypothetical protein